MQVPDSVVPSEEARRRLPEMLRSLTGGEGPRRYVIGRHRRPEAVLVSVPDYEALLERAGETLGAPDPAELLHARRRDVLAIARRHGARNVRVFGSVARGEAGPASDVDLVVRLESGRTLLDVGGLIAELEQLLGRRVDIVTEGGLRPGFRERVLREARPL